MGGFGSLRLVERYPERFDAWGGILALADFPNPAYQPGQNHTVPAVFGLAEAWSSWNPQLNAHKLAGKRIWFTTGASAFDHSMNQTLHKRLDALSISHHFEIVPGGHEFRVVEQQLGAMLRFLLAGEKGR